MSATATRTPIEVFISYSHKDEELKEALREHLALLERLKWITAWHDRRISAGAEWKDEIDAHLMSAGVILLLVSPSFIASDYCSCIEFKAALKRHDDEGIPVIPILLRPVDWTGAPFAHLQALPRGAKPVTDWPNRDAAFRDVARGIREILEPAGPAIGSWSEMAFRPVRRSWRSILLAAVALTFLSRVFFSLVVPFAPLATTEIVVLFLVWSVVCVGGAHAAGAARRRINARRTARKAPNSTDAGVSL